MQKELKQCQRCYKDYPNYLRYCDCIDFVNQKICEKCNKNIDIINYFDFIIDNHLYCNDCWIINDDERKMIKKIKYKYLFNEIKNLQKQFNDLISHNKQLEERIIVLENNNNKKVL